MYLQILRSSRTLPRVRELKHTAYKDPDLSYESRTLPRVRELKP